MPTSRFYIARSTAPAVSPSFSSSWNVTTSAVRSSLVTAKSGTTISIVNSGSPSAINQNTAQTQAVSGALAAQTISGTAKSSVRVYENADSDSRAQIVIRVVSNDGSTVRGVLRDVDSASLESEFGQGSSNAKSRKFPVPSLSPVTLSAVTVQDGDRLVVEWGFHNHLFPASLRQCAFSFGDPIAGTDITEDETQSGVNQVPWIEFGTPIYMQGETVPSVTNKVMMLV